MKGVLIYKEIAVLKFLREFIEQNGFSPAAIEIKNHFGYASKTTASNFLNSLERKGYIKRIPGIGRTIKIL